MALTTVRPATGYREENAPADGTVQREGAGFMAPGQTAKSFNGKVAGNSAVTIPLCTVPAGKILIITDIYISHDAAVVLDQRLQMLCPDAATVIDIFRAPAVGSTSPVEMPGMETQPFVPSGGTLQLTFPGNASTNQYFNIQCIQQDVGVG